MLQNMQPLLQGLYTTILHPLCWSIVHRLGHACIQEDPYMRTLQQGTSNAWAETSLLGNPGEHEDDD